MNGYVREESLVIAILASGPLESPNSESNFEGCCSNDFAEKEQAICDKKIVKCCAK